MKGQLMPHKPLTSDTTGGVEAVERALRVLDIFVPGDAGLSLKEVADRSGINKATILRLSVSLEKFGHIREIAKVCFISARLCGVWGLYFARTCAWGL